LRQSTFCQQVGSLPIGGGVGGARNLGKGGGVDGVGVIGVVAVGVGDAVDGDGGGAGNVSIVERSGALDGRGECAAFSGDGGVDSKRSGDRVGQERGERCSSPSSSSLLSNSTSHLPLAAFLVRLAGGETVFDVSAVSARGGSTRGPGVGAGAGSNGAGNCRGSGGSVRLDSRAAMSATAALEARRQQIYTCGSWGSGNSNGSRVAAMVATTAPPRGRDRNR
jgi:hypothetical protein